MLGPRSLAPLSGHCQKAEYKPFIRQILSGATHFSLPRNHFYLTHLLWGPDSSKTTRRRRKEEGAP